MHWMKLNKSFWREEELFSEDGKKLGYVVKYESDPYWMAASLGRRWRDSRRYFETIEQAKKYVEWLQRPWWQWS